MRWSRSMGIAWATTLAAVIAAEEPDNLELLVPREHSMGTVGGAFAAYGYVPETGDFYTGIFGSGAGIRYYDVSEDVSYQYVYPSDQERMSRSDWITNGYFNADWAGGWYVSSLVLNPTNLTYNGVDYGPSALAAMTTMPSKTDGEWAYTKAFLTYDLREIWAATDRQPDYDNAMFSNPPVEYDRDYGCGYGCVNWNDVITSLASVQEMAEAIGLTNILKSARNGRQAAWSTDGQSVYMVDHGRGNGFGGIWKKNLVTGELRRIYTGEGDNNGLYSEPWVVAAALRNFAGYTLDADQILVGSSESMENRGGLCYVLDSGRVGVVIPAPRLEQYLGQPPKITALTCGPDGTVYFFNQQSPRYSIHMLDPQGRLYDLDNRARRLAWHVNHGNTSSASMSLRLQNRRVTRDPDGTPGSGDEYDIDQVMFMSVNLKGVGGVNVFRPCDFDRDGAVDADDTAFFFEQYRRTWTDTNVLEISDTQDYYDYIKADLNGDAYPDPDTGNATLAAPAVTERDVEVLLRFVTKTPGDANLDGVVDGGDLAILQAHLGGPGSWLDGDFDRNGIVDAADEALWTAHNGETYAITDFTASASYRGGAAGSWDADVRKPDGVTPPDADTLVTLNREEGAVVAGPSGEERVAWLVIGNGGTGAATELQLNGGARLISTEGVHLRRTGRLTGDGELAMGSYGAMGSIYVEEGGFLGAGIDILGGLYLNLGADQALPNFIGDNGANPGGLILDGDAVLTLASTRNSYSGITEIRGGTIRLGASGVIPDGSAVDVWSDAVFDLNDFDETIGPLSGSGFVLLGSATLTIGVPEGSTSTWAGAMSGTGTFVKEGAGVFIVSSGASNTFGRAGQVITVREGTLGIYKSEGLGDPANGVVLSNGTLCALQTLVLPRDVELAAPGAGVCVATGKTLTLEGRLEGAGSLWKTGAGTLRIEGESPYGGPGRSATVYEGRLELKTDAHMGDAANRLVLAGGTARIRETFVSARELRVEASGGELRVDSGKVLTWNGEVTGEGALEKTSTGTVIFGSTVSSEGGLTVSSGAAACAAGTEIATDVFVDSYGTFDASGAPSGVIDLGGHELHVAGTVRGAVVAAELHPGMNGAGTATFSNGFLMEETGSMVWDLRAASGTAGDPYGWDLLQVGEVLQIQTDAGHPYRIRLRSLDIDGLPGPAPDFDGGTNYAWVVATAAGGITGFSAEAFELDASGFENPDALGDWSIEQQGDDLVLRYAAPGPALVLLEPDVTFRWYRAGQTQDVLWASAAIDPFDPIQVELKRASATNGIDGVDWFRFSPPSDNDGIEPIAIPATIAPGLDWHFRVVHEASGAVAESSIPFTIGPDGDDDGLPDVWEEAHFDGTGAETGTGDADSDGATNATEFFSGTDPTDPEDYVRMEEIRRDPPDSIILRWRASPDRYYTLEEAPGAGGAFDPIAETLRSGAGSLTYTGDVAKVGVAVYRVRVEVSDE